MKKGFKSRSSIIILSLIIAFSILASIFLIQEIMKPGTPVPFLTVSEGENSGVFPPENSSYAGERIIIRNQSAWESFWHNHSKSRYPPPPIPTNISWDGQMILVATLGRTSGCKNYVKFLETRREGDTLHAHVEKFYQEYGMRCAAIYNPYHIILVLSAPNVVFVESIKPDVNFVEVCLWSTFLVVVIVISILLYVSWIAIRREKSS